MKNKDSGSNSQIVVVQDLQITGHLHSAQDMWFDGKIEGNLSCEANLSTGTNSSVKGNISANNLYVAGQVFGNLTATNIVIQATANIQGDVKAKQLNVESGALINGNLSMSTSKSPDVKD